MRTAKFLLILLLFAAAAFACLVAFTSRVDEQAVVDALEKAGVNAVVDGRQSEDHFLLVAPTVITAGTGTIYVYQFHFTPFALLETTTIGHNGFSIGSARIDWVSDPHFYRKGSTVVQYIGNDIAVVGVLNSLLGKQFAGVSAS